MSTSLTLRGVEEAQELLADVERQLSPEGAEDVMHLVVGMLHRYSSSITPVDRGILKGSETPDVERSSSSVLGLVYTNTEYAPFVEKWARFFQRTIENEGPNAIALFDDAVESAITG